MRDLGTTLAAVAIVGAILAAVTWWQVSTYLECRGAGFSMSYCLWTVSK